MGRARLRRIVVEAEARVGEDEELRLGLAWSGPASAADGSEAEGDASVIGPLAELEL